MLTRAPAVLDCGAEWFSNSCCCGFLLRWKGACTCELKWALSPLSCFGRLFKKIFCCCLFIYVYVYLCEIMFTTYVQVSVEAKRGQVLNSSESPCGCWKLSLGPLQEWRELFNCDAFPRVPIVKGHSNRKRNGDNWSLCL